MQFMQLILLCHWRFILGLIYTKKCSKFWWLKDYSRRFQSKLKKVYFSVNYVSLLKWAFDVNEELAVQFTHSLMEKEDVLVRKSRRRWIYHQVKNGRVCHLTNIDMDWLIDARNFWRLHKFSNNRYIFENIAAMQETVNYPLKWKTTFFETFQTFMSE